ncbi:MAG: hypothetical protein M0002_01365 [Rhodospirillales bacterium]|nr:hypothetical protein [Rhodospirillales bacterium]
MAANPFPNGVRLMVAGTSGGAVNQWAQAFLPVLGRLLPPGTRVAKENAIGNDGVTGANQFAVRAAPDGTTALLVPGSAATAWLVGDPRVHFDTANWMPVMDGISPGVAVGRVPRSALELTHALRIAASGPAGPELPVLIALQLLGTDFIPVFGLGRPENARAALVAGAVDLIFLHGEGVPQQMHALMAAGMHVLFSLGALDATGQWRRDPELPDVPTFAEVSQRLLGRVPVGPMATAWRAASAAAALHFALVLPQLTPPDIVALWRNIAGALVRDPTVRALASATAVSAQAGPAANASTAAVAVDAAALLALRSWLGRRFGWRQS